MKLILILIGLSGCTAYHRADAYDEEEAYVPPPSRVEVVTVAPVVPDVPVYVSAATEDLYAQARASAEYRKAWMEANGAFVPSASSMAPPVSAAMPSAVPSSVRPPAARTAPSVPCPKGREPVTQAETDACQDAKLRDSERAIDALIDAVGVDNPK